MTKIEKTLKELSDLHRFYNKILKINQPKSPARSKRKVSRRSKRKPI